MVKDLIQLMKLLNLVKKKYHFNPPPNPERREEMDTSTGKVYKDLETALENGAKKRRCY